MNNITTQEEYRKRRLGLILSIILLIVLILICRLQSNVLALNGESEIKLEVGNDYLEEGVTSDTDTELIDIDSSSVDTTKPGNYEVIYKTINKYGGTTIVTRTVNVIDTKPPEIVLRGNDPLNIIEGDSYIEHGAYVLDNVDGNISDNVQISGIVDTNKIGTYTLTYTVSDSSGNISTITRTVNVIGAENPIIILGGYSTEYIEVKTIYNEAGFTAIDKTDNDITDKVVVTGAVDVNVIGTYVLTYNVINSKGKTATATRTIIVRDTNKPDLKLNGDPTIIIPKNTEYIEQGATAIDNYDGDLTAQIIISGTVDITKPGIYFITYEITDSSGNIKQIQRQVIIKNTHNVTDGNTNNTNTTNNTNNTNTTNTIEPPPVEDVNPPIITSIIRSNNSARVTAIDETYEIVEYAVTQSSIEPNESEWVSVTPVTSLSTKITELSDETNYYLWVKNTRGKIASKEFSTVALPIPIYTKEQLSKVGSNEIILVLEDVEYQFSTNAPYRLENNIDLTGINWTPLPTFSGKFYGNNKTVSNLTINSNKTIVGLFSTNNGTIKNLYLENVDILNTITSGSSVYVGGIAGKLGSGNAEIENCYVTGTISNMRDLSSTSSGVNYTGGIVGSASGGFIIGCYNTAQISDTQEGSNNVSGSGARHNCVGGIAGESSSAKISNCFNTGNVIGINNVVGISGGGSTANYAGGISGYLSGGSITTCYNIGVLSTNKGSNFGGISGWSSSTTLTDCYWYKGISNVTKGIGYDSSSTVTNLIELSYENIKNQSSFTGFDFTDIWSIDVEISSPYLKNLPRPNSVNL